MNSCITTLRVSLSCFVVTVLTLPQSAIGEEPQKIAAEHLEFFEKDVRPLLVAKCYECHSASEVKGGLRLDSRPGILAGGDSGPVLVPGDASRSRLMEAVRYQNLDLQMPPDGRLTDGEIAILEKWIQLGAPDPREAVEAIGTGPRGMSIEEGRQFWSMVPVKAVSVPAPANANWCRSPVDQFILAQLEARGIQPARMADKRTLIRRVTFDLIGLPPTPDQIAQFLADESPGAYEQLVDRLLASPQYGVRWGRHWLDVARYADSNGLDENLAYGHAWRYRDYVVDAFNSGKSFREFLIEQIAGDLLPHPTQETQIATGFLVLGAKVLAEPDREKLYMDTIDEQIDSTGKAFLGMTLGCARCHDHKFDPIKQKDYYALAAIFKSTRSFGPTNNGAIKHWEEYSFASPEERESLKKIDAEIAAKNSAASKFKTEATNKLRSDAKSKAAKYLAAAARLAPTATLREVSAVAQPLELHPRILHHCRLHLHYHPDDPLFSVWHQLVVGNNAVPVAQTGAPVTENLVIGAATTAPAAASSGCEEEKAVDVFSAIENHYGQLFSEAISAFEEAKKADAKVKRLSDENLERARAALEDTEGFLAIPPQPEFAFDEATLTEYYRLMEEARVLESNAPDETAAMGVRDGQIQHTIPIHIRGSHRNLGEAVARDLPDVMKTSTTPMTFARLQSGRLELAESMTSAQHPLTARVFVNRLWRWHFGRGLVASTENFGLLGDRPSHPELLDWLARQLVESGWAVKEMQRTLLLSSTYQMASLGDETSGQQADPENTLLWKFPIMRLQAEQIRDAILAVSGRLDMHLGGKVVPLRNRQFVFNHTSKDHTRYDSLRRAMYLPVIRNNLYTFFEQFDFPDPTMPTGNRNSTVVAPQSLLLMNDELVMDSAAAFANRVMSTSASTAERVRMAYETAFGRSPSDRERERVQRFLDELMPQLADRGEDAEATAWSLVCQSLLASNEFIYVR